jgi:hypothetical protein
MNRDSLGASREPITKAPHTERQKPMELYFRVRNVLHTTGKSAVTLDPVEWLRESDTEYVDLDGENVPALEETTPDDPRVTTIDNPGGAVTELRFDGETELRPRDLVTITVSDAIPEPRFTPEGERLPD